MKLYICSFLLVLASSFLVGCGQTETVPPQDTESAVIVTDTLTDASQAQGEVRAVGAYMKIPNKSARSDFALLGVSTINNTTEKKMTSFYLTFAAWDSTGHPVQIYGIDHKEGDFAFIGKDSSQVIPAHTEYSNKAVWKIDLSKNKEICYLKAIVSRAEFEDGSVWINPQYESWKDMYINKQVSLS